MRAARLAPLLALTLALPAAAQQDPGWVAARTAKLQALDKVTARVTVLETPVNQPIQFGTLRVTVRACNARPPEEVPDAAAWLEVLDTRNDPNGAAAFRGWMFANAPGVSMLEHPVYDLRILECR
ncbi:DUF2155 domain-containing protein [Teichococcus cervicalis]|uniref:Cellulase-like protein n=1 Tax=Pseudoroseomonas cervicalis ATCC 49957 TaxID=525371 RepID=D5RN92_9PROT|nr:DUF2155 domain-containing protein [Pseudoroseomonas cervicalis]EFH11223.1 hypothetical protein HMPREF0731_2553 [Pseudoroseomonas cervicalis ATCC 49957]